MRYILNEEPWILARFTTGDAVGITIRDLSDDSIIVNAAAMAEVGTTGWFKYQFAPMPAALKEYLYITSNAIEEHAGVLILGGYPEDIKNETDVISSLPTEASIDTELTSTHGAGDWNNEMSAAELHTGLDSYTNKADYKANITSLATEVNATNNKDEILEKFPPVLYENSDGNITDWVEATDPYNVYALSDGGDVIRIDATNPVSNAAARYAYTDATALMQENYGYRFNVQFDETDSANALLLVGVRTDGNSGYWFQRTLGTNTGSWSPHTNNWANVVSFESCVISPGDEVKIFVRGLDEFTNVWIYINDLLTLRVAGPTWVSNTGSIGIGIKAGYYPPPSTYLLFRDVLVWPEIRYFPFKAAVLNLALESTATSNKNEILEKIPTVLYENSDGNVADWVEVFDNNSCCEILDNGSEIKLEATNPPGNSYGIYRLGSRLWKDMSFKLRLEGSAEQPFQFFIGTRVNAAASYPTIGYLFYKASGGSFVPQGLNWNTVMVVETFTLEYDSEIELKISGSGATTRVQIFVDDRIRFDATDPSTVYDEGTIAVGIFSHFIPKPTMYFLFHDLLVWDKQDFHPYRANVKALPMATEIDDELTAAHGSGDWNDEMSEAELHTGLDSYTNKADYKANITTLTTEANATINKNEVIAEVGANETLIKQILALIGKNYRLKNIVRDSVGNMITGTVVGYANAADATNDTNAIITLSVSGAVLNGRLTGALQTEA